MTKEKQNIKLEKVDDKTACENLLVKYAELENKIADIKANCDLAIEGRDIKIKELENKNAGLEERCEISQDEVSRLIQENAELKADNDARKYAMVMSEKVEKQLREQVEAMKCCENCKHYSASCCCNLPFDDCFELSAWELRK